MGLRSDIQTDIVDAFNIDLYDAAVFFTIERSDNTYNLATGENETVITSYNSRGVFSSYRNREIHSDHIKPTDFKLLILQSEIEIEPKIDDFIFTDNRYKVISVKKDSANVIWILQCRM